MRSGLRQTLLLSRSFSRTSSRLEQQYDYSKISNIIRSPSPAQKLIDVREPHEYKDGHIPTSINIPLSSFESTLTLSPTEFERSLGFEKPKLEEEVVFYCKSGVRSTSASKIAEGLGYKAVGNYKGSWTDYSSRSSSSSSSTPSPDATSANAKRLFSTSARSFAANKAPNPNEKDGAGEGAAGGIDLKKMNQKEDKRAEGDKKQEKKSGNLAAAGEEESESVRSGADLAAGKKFE